MGVLAQFPKPFARLSERMQDAIRKALGGVVANDPVFPVHDRFSRRAVTRDNARRVHGRRLAHHHAGGVV